MKRLLFILLLGLILKQSLFSQNSYLLKKGIAGDYMIEMSVDELYYLAGKENTKITDLFLEGLFSPAIKVYSSGNLSMVGEIDCGNIWRIRVLDKRYKTEKGVGVDSKFEELNKNYENLEILLGEGNIFGYVEELGMSFALDFDYSKLSDYENVKPKEISPEAKIKWILILK